MVVLVVGSNQNYEADTMLEHETELDAELELKLEVELEAELLELSPPLPPPHAATATSTRNTNRTFGVLNCSFAIIVLYLLAACRSEFKLVTPNHRGTLPLY